MRRRRFRAGEREGGKNRCQNCGVSGISLHLRSPIEVQTGCYNGTTAGEMRQRAKELLFCCSRRDDALVRPDDRSPALADRIGKIGRESHIIGRIAHLFRCRRRANVQ